MSSNTNCKTFSAFDRKCEDEQSVWFFFLRDATGQLAQCTKCKSEIKIAGGSTKGMHVHLKSKHGIDLLKKKAAVELDSGSAGCSNSQSSKVKKTDITAYFAPESDKTLPAVLLRMTAVDGLPFSVFCTSSDLRAALKAKGYADIPTSHNSIKSIVLDYAKRVRDQVSTQIKSEKSNNSRFSLTFDEWTSSRNRRYININVHAGRGKFWSLGLVRIEGSMPAEECIRLVQNRLSDHGLNLYNDIDPRRLTFLRTYLKKK